MPLTADSIQLGPFHGGVRYDIPVEEVKAFELSDMENTRLGTGGQGQQNEDNEDPIPVHCASLSQLIGFSV